MQGTQRCCIGGAGGGHGQGAHLGQVAGNRGQGGVHFLDGCDAAVDVVQGAAVRTQLRTQGGGHHHPRRVVGRSVDAVSGADALTGRGGRGRPLIGRIGRIQSRHVGAGDHGNSFRKAKICAKLPRN